MLMVAVHVQYRVTREDGEGGARFLVNSTLVEMETESKSGERVLVVGKKSY